jgi:hypothetical protein
MTVYTWSVTLQANGPAPYTTAAAAIAAIEAFRERGFSPITAETLTRAGVPESIAGRTLNSLKQLGLVDAEGAASEQFKELRLARGDEEYQARLQSWLRGVYEEVLQYTDPSSDSPDRVAEAFRSYEPAGQRKAMAALLIGLWKLSGLPVAGDNGTQRTRPPAKRRPSAARPPSGRSSKLRVDENVDTDLGDQTGLDPGLVGLLRLIPRGKDASWTADRREAFLNAFRAVLDFSVPVVEKRDLSVLEDDFEEEP